MPTERDYHDGRWHANIRRRRSGDGHVYDARITQGRGQSASFPTLTAARAWRTKELARIQSGTVVADARLTLEDYVTHHWLPFYQSHHRESSYMVREGDCRVHIAPALGRTPIARLSPQQIQAFDQTLVTERKPATVGRIASTLSAALNQAVRWEMLPRNPAKGATPPPIPKRVPTLWTPEQTQAFLAAEDDPDWRCLWTLLALTGMRRGEALALTWADIDWENHAIRIERTMTRTQHGYVVGEAKTAGSRRVVAVPDALLTLLREAQSRQALQPCPERGGALEQTQQPNLQKLLVGRGVKGKQGGQPPFIFIRANGLPLSFSMLDSRFRAVTARAGLPHARQHDLRHLNVTMGLELGIPLKVLSERVGHANIGITAAIYAHVTREMDRGAAILIAERLMGESARDADERTGT
jgi:integrase